MSSCVFVKQLVQHVLNNPKHYPGPHNFAQPRTSQGLAALDTTRQMMLIWDAMSQHMLEQLESGKSVNVQGFGTFTFEPLVLQDPSNPKARSEIGLRPCFVVHQSLREALIRYPGKEEIRTGPNEGSIFQQARRVVFLNEVPIAAGCYYKTDVIKSATKALFSAVVDLANRDYNLSLDFGGSIKVNIQNRNLTVNYKPSLTRTVQQSTRRASPAPLSDTWRSGKMSSTMLNFIERPKSPEMVAMRNRTATLKVLSLDMNSCVKAT